MNQYEFHVSRVSRQKYQLDQTLFSLRGTALTSDYSKARRFAEQMGLKINRYVPASDINAMGMIHEVLHILLRKFEEQYPELMRETLARTKDPETTLSRFNDEFPPTIIYSGEITPDQYLSLGTSNKSHKETTLEELLMLHLSNINPAYQTYKELFDDSNLSKTTDYLTIIARIKEHFSGKPGLSSEENIYEMLTAPLRIAPNSLLGQLQYLAQRWGHLIGEDILQMLMRSMDYSKEETMRGNFTGGFAGNAQVIIYENPESREYERFSPDKDWMPQCVLIAKNTYVWMEQLSRKYERWIRTLDQIPDEELDILASRGFTALWLIGLWERSLASQKIKQLLGDMDAVASAYSLDKYDIASDLGGWSALQNLRSRAWVRGIRLSADMVPNHMGIDSEWVINHPSWFLSLDHPPYQSYSFTGPDLSNNGYIGIQLEDHYYSKTDAAVVFKRWDRKSGEARYIYHGNDGTSMPWNDTAQLDYSKSEVREAVIQTILHVARNFPIIRFDAAMTLAKKHIQRLWFPEPGGGGAIPSRAEHGMTRTDFDSAIRDEFWREVVDRVAAEVPDTLLLAEAFWLMEGYFVRTLGMHRVYNSAFMHMLRDEDNAKYRSVIKNTLEFDPQVIKRFVNFMNNPDEKTAIDQFGDGDKYFGVCTMLATLPGLPMFGHGQVEGYHEKYGMEFRKPKWDEKPKEELVLEHERRISPLLHKRHIFSEADNFLLYDFFTADGHVNEDVFAYSNRQGNEKGLVIYNNKYTQTRGWIKISSAFMDKRYGELMQMSLSTGLAIPNDGYAIFKDYTNQKEYIRPCEELIHDGLYVELNGYQCHVFLDWRFVPAEGWEDVYKNLHGNGCVSVQELFNVIKAKDEATAKEIIKKDTKASTKINPQKKKVYKKSKRTTRNSNRQ